MASADSGRKSYAAELQTLRSNCGGVIWLPALKAGTLDALPIGEIGMDAEESGLGKIAGTNRGYFGHGDGSILELWFALNGGDNDTGVFRINALLPMINKVSGAVKSRMVHRDPLAQVTVTACSAVGVGTVAGSPPAVVPAAFRLTDTIVVNSHRLVRNPVVRGPRDAAGTPQAADNHCVCLWMDAMAAPDFEIEVGAMSGTSTDGMVGYRFLSPL